MGAALHLYRVSLRALRGAKPAILGDFTASHGALCEQSFAVCRRCIPRSSSTEAIGVCRRVHSAPKKQSFINSALNKSLSSLGNWGF